MKSRVREVCLNLPITYGALCSGRSEFLAAGLQKAVAGLIFFF